jgi:8-oxo-dGTP pyrophosphatase MutT (NUDIX family)
MYITIYVGETPVLLCSSKDEIPDNFRNQKTLIVQETSSSAIQNLLTEIESDRIDAGILICQDLNHLYNQFSLYFTEITAAGGVVINPKEEVLLIFRRGKWDLPKGKLDEGETIDECAVREVKEETGLQNAQITGTLPSTYHTYQQDGIKILKKSVWFKMFAEGDQHLTPQTEEDITEIKWVPITKLQYYMNHTYPSVKDVLNNFITDSL